MISDHQPFYSEVNIEFEFFSGFSKTQKSKSVLSLHEAFKKQCPSTRVLEVSNFSPLEIGKKLSAFNLSFSLDNQSTYTVESVFQSSKVFENGGPYTDLLSKSSYHAKKDARLQTSGSLLRFQFSGLSFPLEPKSYFYDWLYVNALQKQSGLHEKILTYSAFTDIAFNPQKSVNCQARSAAIFCSLTKAQLLNEALKNPIDFKKIVYMAK